MKPNVRAAAMAWKSPAFASIYILENAQPKRVQPSARKKKGKALRGVADREFVTQGCALLSKGLQQLQAASSSFEKQVLSFPPSLFPKNNLGALNIRALTQGSLWQTLYLFRVLNLLLKTKNLHQLQDRTPLGELFPRGGREPSLMNARLETLESICPHLNWLGRRRAVLIFPFPLGCGEHR